MGIIQKQSIRSSIFIAIGFGIGAINMLVLFPMFLSQGEIGITRAMLDISLTLSMLCTLGSVSVVYKFYPFYNYYLKDRKNDLPFITGMVCLAGFLLISLFGYIFNDFIIRKLGKSPQFASYFYTVYPLTFLMLTFTWLEGFAWGLKKTTITNFLKEAGVRIITTVLILLYGFHLVSLNGFINLFSLSFLIPVIILLAVLIKSGQWKFSVTGISSVTRRLKRRMITFGLFIFGANFLNVLAKTNDTILIIGLQGERDLAVFTIASYITTIMEIPQRSMNAISIPVLAESWKNNDLKNIDHIYKKSVSNLLVIALALFGLMFLNSHNLMMFLGKNYDRIGLLIFVMGMAKVIELGTGINGLIIGTSNHWKFDFYTNVLYTIFSIPLNFFLIKALGLYGVAFSQLISTTLYNSVRFIFLYKKFGLQPYTIKCLYLLLISVGIYGVIYIIPAMPNIYLDGVIRTFLFAALFIPVVYRLNVSPDLNQMGINLLKRIRKF